MVNLSAKLTEILSKIAVSGVSKIAQSISRIGTELASGVVILDLGGGTAGISGQSFLNFAKNSSDDVVEGALKSVDDESWKVQVLQLLKEGGFMTNSIAGQAAKNLGYRKTTSTSKTGRAIFENTNAPKNMRFISGDSTAHKGGFWKAASNIEDLTRKDGSNRTGTFNIDLSVQVDK